MVESGGYCADDAAAASDKTGVDTLRPMSFADNLHGGALLDRLRKQRETGRYCDVLLACCSFVHSLP